MLKGTATGATQTPGASPAPTQSTNPGAAAPRPATAALRPAEAAPSGDAGAGAAAPPDVNAPKSGAVGCVCSRCGAALVADEIALTKKLINRGATEFLCLDCLAAFFGCSVERLHQKIEQFRRDGCALFL